SDVVDDDDGVVDHEAGADGESHQREIVDAVVAEIHHAKGADERKGDGDARDNGGPVVSKEGEDHEDDEDDGDDQGDLDVVHGSADRGGAIHSDIQVQRGRHGSAQIRKQGKDAVDGFDHVGAGLPEDSEHDRALAIGETHVADVFHRVVHFGDVAKADGRTDVASDNERSVFVGFEELVAIRDGPGV